MFSKLTALLVGQCPCGLLRMASAAAAVKFGFRTCLERMLKISSSFLGMRPRQKRAASWIGPERERAFWAGLN